MAIKAKATITLAKVNDGADGSKIKSITTEFYLSASKTTQTGGLWTTTMPTWVKGKYLWTRSKIVYENPSKTEYTTPICDSSWEASNDVSDDLHDNYYTKVETDAKIKITEDSIKSTVKQEVVKIEIGTRNLLLKTGEDKSTEFQGIANDPGAPEIRYELSEYGYNNLKDKDSVSISFDWVADGNPMGYFYIQTDLEEKLTEDIEITENYGVSHYTKSMELKNGGFSEVRVIGMLAESILTISNIKLERGVKSTDWSPAPEDLATDDAVKNAQETADKAQSSTDAHEERITISESQIKQLSDSISTLVIDKNGSSLMTQTGDGWTFNIGAIQDSLDDASKRIDEASGTADDAKNLANKLDGLVDDISKKTAYIVMTVDDKGDPCIELGKENNPFKVRITNTSVDFMEGSNKIAYISNNSLYIEKAIIKNELQIGDGTGYIWKRRSNGNMGLRYVKG